MGALGGRPRQRHVLLLAARPGRQTQQPHPGSVQPEKAQIDHQVEGQAEPERRGRLAVADLGHRPDQVVERGLHSGDGDDRENGGWPARGAPAAGQELHQAIEQERQKDPRTDDRQKPAGRPRRAAAAADQHRAETEEQKSGEPQAQRQGR